MPGRTTVSSAIAAVLGATAALATPTASADEEPAPMSVQEQAPVAADPHLWLEDVTGEKALDWVRQQNARTEAELAATPGFAQRQAEILAILDSDAKIPAVAKIGVYYYNFWQDKQHVRGIWRRTTLAEYRKPNPAWETILDLDALNAKEGKNWVWHGAQCLRPAYTRCLLSLSPGGSDAEAVREFDLATRSFVDGGFELPVAKGAVSWIDRDRLFVQTDFGPGSMTSSGYPRIAKLWMRGTPLTAATTVYEGKPDDMYIGASHDDSPGYERDWVSRTLAFYNDELYLRRADGTLQKVEAPNSMKKAPFRQWLFLQPREDWTVAGKTHPAGSLLVAKLDDYLAGKRDLTVLFTPTATTSLEEFTVTRNRVVLTLLDDVKSKLKVLTPGKDGWTTSDFAGAPAIGTVSVAAVDPDESDAVWLTTSGYLTPSTLAIADAGKQPEVLKTMPAFFDASRHMVEQHFASSLDGTRVPYFVVRRKDLPLDGSSPTLLYGYGGFEVSLTPAYSGTLGKAWLEPGGVYVVANIRGGGEYGPRWHEAALKQNRHKAYEDFAAVAKDLVARRITSPAHLAAMGGSNGGLLAGNMLTQYPELFGAIVIQVPLLDMQRYSQLLAGASWMAEYGDPAKPEQWEYISRFSPYHLFDPAKAYPPTFIWTTTRDDRVHPGHARKMAARMLAAGKDVRYFENIEGGHGAGSTNAQAAKTAALQYAFLWNQLKKQP